MNGWECLLDLVCNNTDINRTYQSNHTLESVGKIDRLIDSSSTGTLIDLTDTETSTLIDLELHDALKNLRDLLVLNKRTNEHSAHEVARQKIWCAHFKNRGFDLTPFLNMDVEMMPHVLAWFANEYLTTGESLHWKALYHFIRNHWTFLYYSAFHLRTDYALQSWNE